MTAAKPTSLGDRSLIRSLGLKLSRVVIDAGHGGHDTGSIGPTGFTEKELVLDVARRLKTLIEDQMGAEVSPDARQRYVCGPGKPHAAAQTRRRRTSSSRSMPIPALKRRFAASKRSS